MKEIQLQKFQEAIFAINDAMANHPEIGMKEYESSAAMVKILREHGMEVECPFDGMETAYMARINPEKERRVAILAEYDALPEIGHACGHCASGSSSILAALALNDIKDDLDFGVDLIGTPDEEMAGAKCIMAEHGIFDGYDFAIMVHMGPYTTASGEFIALDAHGFRFHGKPAHAAAAPQEGRNALNAARLFFDATDMMRQHIIQDARLHGYIINGGSASNVVPDYTDVEFLARAPKRKDLDEISDWIKDCAKAAALATHTELEIYHVGYPFHDLHTTELGDNMVRECMDEIGIDYENVPGMVGSSDIGNVDYHCPAFHPFMSIGQSPDINVHTREFAAAMTCDSTHQAIVNSANLMIKVIDKLYGNPELLAEIQREHKAYRGY